VPEKSQPVWVSSAKSRVVLKGTGDWLISMLPDDPESTILKRLKRPKPEDGEPVETPPERSDLGSPADPEPTAYGQADRVNMQRLIEGKAKR
jgi:membrane protein required for colicin V production